MRIAVLADNRVVVVDEDDNAVDVTHLLSPADRLGSLADRLDQVRDYAGSESAPRSPVAGLSLAAPSPSPRTVLAAPVNFAEHKGELGDRSPEKGKLDARQLGLIVLAPASITGPDTTIELPALAGREFHFEGEIAVVIGREARSVPAEHALDYVLGYTGLLDITMRLSNEGKEDRSMRKSFHTFTPLGPYVLTSDAVDDPADLSLELSVNGDVRQQGQLCDLIVDVPNLVATASSLVPLRPGDVIATGTPSGVGPIVAGDVLELTVSGVGKLAMHVIERSW